MPQPSPAALTPTELPPEQGWLILGEWAISEGIVSKSMPQDDGSPDKPVVLVRPAHVYPAGGAITLMGVSDPECCGCNVVLIG